jgi:ABC-2 type transport system permease protein
VSSSHEETDDESADLAGARDDTGAHRDRGRRAGAPPDEAVRAAGERVRAMLDGSELRDRGGWYGTWTLFGREIKRFWNIFGQSVLSPVVTTMLYFLVFGYSLEDRLQEIQGVPYVDFLVPGLVMLAMINNAFINSAFSLFLSKIQGTIVDLLVTPLSHGQIMIGYVAASMIRSMLIGAIIWGVATALGAGTLHHIGLTLLFMALTAASFALLGIIVAIVATEFEHVNLLPNFLLTPLTFLGGVFYSLEMLPGPWDTVSRFNPVLYMVNGLRMGMTGYADVPVWQGLVILSALCLAFGSVAYWMLWSGKELRE